MSVREQMLNTLVRRLFWVTVERDDSKMPILLGGGSDGGKCKGIINSCFSNSLKLREERDTMFDFVLLKVVRLGIR